MHGHNQEVLERTLWNEHYCVNVRRLGCCRFSFSKPCTDTSLKLTSTALVSTLQAAMIWKSYRRCFPRAHLKWRGGRHNGFLFEPLDSLETRLLNGPALLLDLGSGSLRCCSSCEYSTPYTNSRCCSGTLRFLLVVSALRYGRFEHLWRKQHFQIRQ